MNQDLNSNLFLVVVVVTYLLYTWVGGTAIRGSDLRESKKMQWTMAQRYLQVLWLLGVGFAALNGYFRDFSTMPPNILYAIVGSLIFLFATAWSKGIGELSTFVNPRILVMVQTFRVAVEIILHLMVRAGQLPPQMTFTGRNFDIIVGFTAPIVGLTLIKGGKILNKKALLIWNVVGMLILFNTVVNGLLSAPTVFQVFTDAPTTSIIGEFPYIWLPTYLAPLAFFFHIQSIRQCLKS